MQSPLLLSVLLSLRIWGDFVFFFFFFLSFTFRLSFGLIFLGAETMAFFMKTMISNQVKSFGFGGGSEEKKEEGGTSDPAAAQGMTREEYEEYQKQVIEEK